MKKCIGLALVFASFVYAEAPGVIAIRNARVVTVSGPTLDKATVVVRDGLIQDVGQNVSVPADAWIIEGEGLTVYPGLIDALGTIGIAEATPATTTAAAGRGGRQNAPATPAAPTAPVTVNIARGPEDRPLTTSWVDAADVIQTSDRRIETFRNGGFTTSVTFPTRGIFAGQGAVIDLAGDKPGQMVVASPVGQYVTVNTGGRGEAGGGGYPGSLLGAFAYIRQIYIDADYYKDMKSAYAKNPRGMARPQYDRALEGVLASPRMLLPANRAVEIVRMIRFANELKQPVVLYGGHEAYRAAEDLKAANVPILLNLKWPERDREGNPDAVDNLRTFEMREKAPSAASVLSKAGVKFAFYTGGLERPRDVFRAVKRAMDAGLSQQDALRALTLSAAEIYGVSDRLGSIEKGKIANLVVTKGDLFGDRPQVQFVFVDGAKFEPVAEAPPSEGAGRAPTREGEER